MPPCSAALPHYCWRMRNTPPPETLIACPRCDALHLRRHLGPDQRAACGRCSTLLVAPRTRSFLHVIALAFTAMILMIGAIFFPFLSISARGLYNASSVFEAAMSFSEGVLVPLSLAVLLMIVALPVARFGLIVYTLWPLGKARPPYRHARIAFRLAEEMQPWSMAEIFIIGTAVALVKVAGLATVSLGPAFWAFCALIIVNVLHTVFMSKAAIWDAIDEAQQWTS